ncbi:hypothetical protein AJ79_06107 [Helicocarpus griseus UAMH5409]|uniref:Uncharacterized protein n=1 Tax=Helicocarpus griseus UAMH5409 TaxID=1447875 RepID=A0A2B7XHH9_9EURO|nr:hypothetical protein AJ79_06107 [Helicocarpus griseus UAMH5409]
MDQAKTGVTGILASRKLGVGEKSEESKTQKMTLLFQLLGWVGGEDNGDQNRDREERRDNPGSAPGSAPEPPCTSIFLGHGTEDAWVKVELGGQAYKLLVEMGRPVE